MAQIRSHLTMEGASLVINPLCLLIRQSERMALKLNQRRTSTQAERMSQIDAEWKAAKIWSRPRICNKINFPVLIS